MREDISAMPILTPDYKAPKWLPGAHLQTVIPARFFPLPEIHYRRELIDMPDGDFMIFDWQRRTLRPDGTSSRAFPRA